MTRISGIQTGMPHLWLMRSVDGFHQQDLAYYVAQNPTGNLSMLSGLGTTCMNASTSAPSDSFPGVLALHTGAQSQRFKHAS